MSADFNKLFFNMLSVSVENNSVTVSPNFRCPVCEGKPQFKIGGGSWQVALNRELAFNNRVTFKMPCCGTEISLYVAVHRSKGENDLTVCISSEPIAEGWL